MRKVVLMKKALLAAALTAVPAGAAERVVRIESVVTAPPAAVWRAWTDSAGAAEFFGYKANIELRRGGPYEIWFNPDDERQSSAGMKVLSYCPEEMLSFEWNAPPIFPDVRAGGTWIVVQLKSEGTRTRVTLSHLGWKQGEEWDKAFAFFEGAWGAVMKRLERRFAEGKPIDWSKE
jgi:uncharacterized protein YndB with AHSA1/START domain